MYGDNEMNGPMKQPDLLSEKVKSNPPVFLLEFLKKTQKASLNIIKMTNL